jgi:type I restriction enzyme S subunit
VSWQKVKLGNVCDVRDGTHESPKYVPYGYPLITSKNLTNGLIDFTDVSYVSEEDYLNISKRSKVDFNDILMPMIGTIGNPVLVKDMDPKFAIKNVALVKFRNNSLNSNFIKLVLEADEFKKFIEKQSRGGTQKFLSLGNIRNFEFELPPLEEQKRIAEILDKANEIKTKRELVLAMLDEFAQSIFVEMFGNQKNDHGWKIKRLDQLIKSGDTINYGVVQPGDDCEDGVPLIRAGDVVNKNLVDSSLKKIDRDIEASYKRSRLKGNEILVSCVGSIGSVMLVKPTMAGYNIARAVARISPSSEINRIFLSEYLKSNKVQRYFTSELRTVSQPTLNIKQICETEIFCPPIKLQEDFEKIMLSIERNKTEFINALILQKKLISSLQNQAFTTGFNA